MTLARTLAVALLLFGCADLAGSSWSAALSGYGSRRKS